MKRENLQFGHGDARIAILEPNFSAQPIDEQARVFGWANGCPVVEELIVVRGAEKMVPRYRGVNLWFRRAKRELESVEKPWFQYDVPRTAKPGKHEAHSVPGEYQASMMPMNRLVGFALPRLLAEQAATGSELSPEESRRRTGVAIEALKEGAKNGRTGDELLAITAEQIRRYGDLEPEVILQMILPAGWLVENPEPKAVEVFKDKLSRESRELFALYKSLTPQQKKALELA